MKVVSSDEMKSIEAEAISIIGIPSLSLMETASSKFSERCFDIIKNLKNPKIAVFAGKGNNGGDGLAFCRHIFQKNNDERKICIKIFFVGDEEKASDECKVQLGIIKKLIERNYPFQLFFTDNMPVSDIKNEIKYSDLIVDAIIGTGLKFELRDNISEIVNIINDCNATTAAVDCPTGISSDCGKILKNAVKADFTVTFHLPKVGLLIGQGALYSGKVFVEDINIPFGLEKNIKTNVLSKIDAKKMLPIRNADANKGTFGKAFIFAGSDNMPGACVISSLASYRTGAGLVYVCAVESVCNVVRNFIPEVVTKVLCDVNGTLCKESFYMARAEKADVIAVGPGIGTKQNTAEFLECLIENANATLVIDADALNIISKDLSLLTKIKSDCVITPHIAEMSRLTGKSIEDIKNNLIDTATEFSKKYNVVVVLKDFKTVIANPKGEVYINTTGSPALAKGGSGDCLTGVLTALIAQGMSCFNAAVLSSYLFGLSGEFAQKEFGQYGTLARNCADAISIIMNDLENA